jgi:hypothetical protein
MGGSFSAMNFDAPAILLIGRGIPLRRTEVIWLAYRKGYQSIQGQGQDPGVAAPDAALLFCKATKE